MRRQYKELYYYNEQGGECDFVAFHNTQAEKAIQVCYELDERNFKREYDGLLAAMRSFKLKEGVIITLDKKDRFEEEDGLVIQVVRSFEYLSANL